MSQTWNVPQNAQNAKSLDLALVIAGWPTIYTVAKSYSLPAAGDLSTTKGFVGPTRAWANLPDSIGVSAKGRPEEGSCTIAQIDIDVLDRVLNGRRDITYLCSRQAFLDDSTTNPRTSLATLVATADDLPVASLEGFSTAGGLAYVGLECVKYTTTQLASGGQPAKLIDCSRGHLLTTATAHPAGAGVYPFMPSIYWRRAYLYKGYQNLGLDQWKRAFGGVVGGVAKSGAKVTFSLFDTTWLAYANGEQVICGPPASGAPGLFRRATLATSHRDGNHYTDYYVFPIEVEDSTNLASGHHLLHAGGWFAVTGLLP